MLYNCKTFILVLQLGFHIILYSQHCDPLCEMHAYSRGE